MNVDELKNRLSTDDIIRIMEYLGADIGTMTEEFITFTSLCHNSDTHKFYYYPQTMSTYCFVCGNVDVITIVQQELGLAFHEAMKWICEFCNIPDGVQHKFGRPKKVEYVPREVKKKEVNLSEQLPMYSKSILNTFYDIPIVEWINEGIDYEILKMYDIKFDINTNSIIIPHYDINNRLIGIRCRNLDEFAIEKYGKYIPYRDVLGGTMFNHKIGNNLYGLSLNKNKIQEFKKIILVESEKSVMKLQGFYGENNISVATCGSNLTDYQIELIKSLGVTDVMFAFDKEDDEKFLKKLNKLYVKSSYHFNVFYIEDTMGLLNLKDSPCDKGRDTFEKLLMNKKKFELNVTNQMNN